MQCDQGITIWEHFSVSAIILIIDNDIEFRDNRDGHTMTVLWCDLLCDYN